MPSPNGAKAIHEGDVFPQVGVEPQTRWKDKICDAKEDNTKNGHEEEKAEEEE